MNITINGEARALQNPVTVAGMLTQLGIASGKVAVERNLEIVPKSAFETTTLTDGDRIEIVHFIGGGNADPISTDTFTVAGTTYNSRLLVGTGKYKDFEETARAIEASGAEIVTVAVRRVNFTGSTHVGRIIAQSAARHLKPVLLELGGKAPCVILDDADLDAAVAGAAFGAFMNQGQICMSTERIVVDEAIADAFVQRLGAKAQTLKAGREGLPLGSMVSCAAASKASLEFVS